MNTIRVILIALIVGAGCYPNWTRVHYETNPMTGQQSVRSGVLAYQGMQQALGAKITRVEGYPGTAFQVMGEAGSGWCDDDTLEMTINGRYCELEAVDFIPDYNFTCAGINCLRSTRRMFVIPDSVQVRENSEVFIQWCGLYRQVNEGSVERFAQVHNERF